MHEFIFVLSVHCLCSNLLGKLLMHNCACAKHAKHVNAAYVKFHMYSRVETANDPNVFNNSVLKFILCIISSNPRNFYCCSNAVIFLQCHEYHSTVFDNTKVML